MPKASGWEPGRLLVGWAVGVLMTIGLVTTTGGWYEYRQLSTLPGSASPARQITGTESACQAERDSAINVGGFETVPGQADPCYLRRPRIRPWQWSEGVKEQIDRLASGSAVLSHTATAPRAQLVRPRLGLSRAVLP